MIITSQELTIYTKVDGVWKRYAVNGTYRNVSKRNHEKQGVDTTDEGIVRINEDMTLNTGDIVVNKLVFDEDVSLSKLKDLYGRHNVFTIKSISRNFYGTDIDHIKLTVI